MKKNVTALLLCAALLLSSAGCGAKQTETVPAQTIPDQSAEEKVEKKTENQGTSEQEIPSEEVTAQSLVAVSVSNSRAEQKSEDGSLLLATDIDQPSVSIADNPRAADALNSALQASAAKRAAEAEMWLAQAKDDRQMSEDNGTPFSPYGVRRTVRTARMDSSVLSIVYTDSDSTGGVHPNNYSTGVTYDVKTGSQLTLEDLTDDVSALRAIVERTVTEKITAPDQKDSYFEDAAAQVPTMLAEGTWFLSEDGLVVLANPYLLAPYAAGILRFTVPYDQLTGVLSERWMPEQASWGDRLELSRMEESGSPTEIARVRVDEGGTLLSLTTPDAVRHLCVSQVSSQDGQSWYAGKDYLAVSALHAGEAVVIQAVLPETMPNLMVSFVMQDGTRACYGIGESGKDGSVLLIPLENVS